MSPAHPALSEAMERLDVPELIGATIAERHSEPHRHYHTLRHIDLMLRELPADDPFSREMVAATLFHDIVYDPTRSDNEDQSLALFLSVADQLAPLDTALVAEMILATKSHHFRGGISTQDLAINRLLKADLSILWHPDPQVYAWYAQGVRQEYAFVPDAQFHEARTRILTTLRDDLLASGQLPANETEALKRNVASELA
ncbi:hypothetical protein [Novosphingobium sp. JCM 18896]|uniref:HD domain-containing protein n=1 Tax=Novosphingobium sp. JCM 18896 TaxID=2989731 RepID=UPI0022213A75|nr:hypothetical protein [Novosphingobium sp. JCM 18896]